MFVVIVSAHVKQEYIPAFIEATFENAKNSVQEDGITRFDFYQQADDPSWFSLIEIYRSEDAPEKHRATAHYIRWKDTVEIMLVEPRTKVKSIILFPAVIEN